MTRSIYYVAACVIALGGGGRAMAQSSHRVSVVQRLPGYVCVEVSVSDDGPGQLAKLPPIYGAPVAGAAQIGVGQETMIADAPVKNVGGYVRVLMVNKRPGWMLASLVKQWHSISMPTSRCYPAMISNGLLGFDYDKTGG